MNKWPLLLLVLLLAVPLASWGSYQTPNPELRGIPINVTVVATSITSVPTAVNGSTLHRVSCTITNPDPDFNVRVTFASATYTAKDYINAKRCWVIPPNSTKTIVGPNYSSGPWTADWMYGKTMYADVSPTPKTVSITLDAEKRYNTPPD